MGDRGGFRIAETASQKAGYDLNGPLVCKGRGRTFCEAF